MKEFVQWSRLFEEAESTVPGAAAPAERDTAVMASILKRMRRVGAESEDNASAESDTDSESIEHLQDEYEEDEV